jgi:hypothetical protein
MEWICAALVGFIILSLVILTDSLKTFASAAKVEQEKTKKESKPTKQKIILLNGPLCGLKLLTTTDAQVVIMRDVRFGKEIAHYYSRTILFERKTRVIFTYVGSYKDGPIESTDQVINMER